MENMNILIFFKNGSKIAIFGEYFLSLYSYSLYNIIYSNIFYSYTIIYVQGITKNQNIENKKNGSKKTWTCILKKIISNIYYTLRF